MNTIPVPVATLQRLLGISEEIKHVRFDGSLVYLETNKDRPEPANQKRMEFNLPDETS